MFDQRDAGEFINIAKFLKIANPILLTTPEHLNKRMVIKQMKMSLKKRRGYHLKSWKKKGTHAALKYGGKLPNEGSDSSAEEEEPKVAKPHKQKRQKQKATQAKTTEGRDFVLCKVKEEQKPVKEKQKVTKNAAESRLVLFCLFVFVIKRCCSTPPLGYRFLFVVCVLTPFSFKQVCKARHN